jgi:glycolate oxidase subunit GlcD
MPSSLRKDRGVKVDHTSSAVARDLRTLLGEDAVVSGSTSAYLTDETETRGLRGYAEAVCLPNHPEQVASAVAWCYERGIPIVPRGGGTGYAGGAVPVEGGVVVALERMARVRSFDPLLWRIEVEAGVRTADLRRVVRENGLFFPPDPGAAEQSQIGGNVATNAGGPHTFKYGVTGAWVTGIEAILAPGELVRVGGAIRKDVAGYDLKALLIGSEGTLGIVTAVWLKLIPAPDVSLPVVGFYGSIGAGTAAITAVLGNGIAAAALEYLDSGALDAARRSFPASVPEAARFMVLADADGSAAEVARLQAELREVLADGAESVHVPASAGDVAALWRWRDGVSIAVTAQRGGKISEDIVVPLDRLGEAIERTLEIGERHALPTCSWGHAGDGNVHSTFMVDVQDDAELVRAQAAAEELFALAVELGGSISGEHGIGWVKRGQLARQWAPRLLEIQASVRAAYDPKGLMNPGKKR